MALDPALLRALDMLLQTQSVRGTAVRLGRSQSAISHRLAQLREQLDDEILVKRGRGLVMTAFARRIRPRVRAIMQAIDELSSPDFADPTLTQAPPLRRLRLPAQVDVGALLQALVPDKVDVIALMQVLGDMGQDGPVEATVPL
jgi:DNA-binding transcriptional LysR family regulator